MKNNKGFVGIGVVLIIIVVLIVSAGAYYLGTKNNSVPKNTTGLNEDPLTETLDPFKQVIENKLPEWKNYWQKLIPSFDISKFKKVRELDIVSTKYTYNPNDNKLREVVYVYSPDKTKIIDPKGGMELYEKDGQILESYDVDSSVKLIDLKDKTYKQILSCGTPCVFSGAVWLDNNTFVVVGRSEYYPENGETRCTVDTKCTDVATLNIFDLINNKNILYYGPEVSQKITRGMSDLNSDENSLIEIFNNQPGEIKSLEKLSSINQWSLTVDLLSRNPKWLPGVDSMGEFFINQNTKIRNLVITKDTKIYKCGLDSKADVLEDITTFINKQKVSYKTAYFDIKGDNITAIYQQCLP